MSSTTAQAVVLPMTRVARRSLRRPRFTADALLAPSARRTIRQPRVQRAVNRTGGTLLIGAGALAVAWRSG